MFSVADKAATEQRQRPYTSAELAELLGCSRHHIYRLAQRGDLQYLRLGRKILFPARVVHALINGEHR